MFLNMFKIMMIPKEIKLLMLIFVSFNQCLSSDFNILFELFCNNYAQSCDVALRVRGQLIGYHLERFSYAKKNLNTLQMSESESRAIWSKICSETFDLCDKAHVKILADFDKVISGQKEDIQKKLFEKSEK